MGASAHQVILTPGAKRLTLLSMRTTLQIDDDVLEAARALARMEAKSLGEVVSRLARKGLAPRPQEGTDRNFPVFAVSEDEPPITPEHVRQALEDR